MPSAGPEHSIPWLSLSSNLPKFMHSPAQTGKQTHASLDQSLTVY
jgi:hypothetical protein